MNSHFWISAYRLPFRKTPSALHAFEEIDRVYEAYAAHASLNEILMDAFLLNQPPLYNGGRLKLSYATQEDAMPPSFVLFVNNEKHLHFSYLRYLENRLRENFDFTGTPLKFIFRKKE